MTGRVANCPACGGPVEFRLSTALVTVCEFCHSVVARGDKKLEDHGKVADLVDTNSPFERGMTGVFEKKSFEIVGRVQYQHPAGGVWDEWYLKFPGDRVKWLAQAQGRYYVTQQVKLPPDFSLPSFDSLSPGERIGLPGHPMTVAEYGTAVARSADGDIPWDFRPNADHRFADLSGPGQEFGSLEFEADETRLFVGREVSLSELGISGEKWGTEPPPLKTVPALQLNCPKCGGQLSLHAPDQSLRITCPNCRALLDCQNGNLKYLETLRTDDSLKPLIKLGSEGTINNVKYTLIGFMVRAVVVDGETYSWTEYLLYNVTDGFRWLVNSAGHWSFVMSLPVSSVTERDKVALFDGKEFRLFDRGTAVVRYVVGEFYWRVTLGEQVMTCDYINPPYMISSERTISERGSELNYSIGTYLEKEVIEQAFHTQELPTPWGVGAIQPAPVYGGEWRIWLIFMWVLIALDIVFVTTLLSRPFSQFHFVAAMIAITIWPICTAFARRDFEAKRWSNSDFSPYSDWSSESSSSEDDE